MEALILLKKKRDIKPNPGFLEQLIKLEIEYKLQAEQIEWLGQEFNLNFAGRKKLHFGFSEKC